MTVLMKANYQWSVRKPDERFPSLDALHAAACLQANQSTESEIALRDFQVTPDPVNGLRLVSKDQPSSNPVDLTNWSFGQLCQRAKAPAAYMRSLSAPLAADCLNEGLALLDPTAKTPALYQQKNGTNVLRAITGDKYARIWNRDVTARLLKLEAAGGWQPAPAAFDGSRGLYLSDRDLFAFMVDNNRRIFETGPSGGLSRGFFAWNSEVGAASFGVQTFFYEYVCGNHRVWGASGVKEVRFRHVGDVNDRAFESLAVELRAYADQSASEDEAVIQRAMASTLGANKEEVLDRVFGLRLPDLTLKLIDRSYDLAETRVDWYGSPRTIWGLTGGMTEVARDLPNADDRVALERASGKLLALAA